jgi:hypothetical protein
MNNLRQILIYYDKTHLISTLGHLEKLYLVTLYIKPLIKVMLPTQPPIQWVPGALSLGVKRPGGEADHSPPSNVGVKK